MNEIISILVSGAASGAVVAVSVYASLFLRRATGKAAKETELIEVQLRLAKAQADATESSSRLMNEVGRKFASSSGIPSGVVMSPCGDPDCPNCGKGDRRG